MTVLAIAQACATRLQIPYPSTLVGNTSNNIILLKAMMEQAALEIKGDYTWPELQRIYSFTLSTGEASYALPGDFDRQIYETHWNQTQHYPLIGPLTPTVWQTYKSGLIATFPQQRFRVMGISNKEFTIDPTPTASENGQICVFEYMSRNTFRPKTWVASTSWTGNANCFYNGNYYSRSGTGAATTGTTPPTWTDTQSDGSISWTYYVAGYFGANPFASIVIDDDEFVLDDQLLVDGAVWRWRQARNLEYMALKEQAEGELERSKVNKQGASTVTIGANSNLPPYIGVWSYPWSNYGV